MFNQNQWLGNYNNPAPPGSNPVNAIEMDIINFSATFLATRVAIKVSGGQTAGYSFNGGTTPDGANDIPADGLWHHVVFPINASTMVAVNDPFGNPPPPLTTLLGSVGELRILHAATPVLNGDSIVARAGVDNIHAIFIPVPEPTGILAAALCVGLVFRPARRWWRGQ
jgi:hypothetical protein